MFTNLLSNLPMYCDDVQFKAMLNRFEYLKDCGSLDDWVYESFEQSFSYWKEIQLIPNFWEILSAVVKDNLDLKFECLEAMDTMFMNSLIREKVQDKLNWKYRTLLFEKLNMILTIYEEIYIAEQFQQYDDIDDIILPDGLDDFYNNIHEEFYNKFIKK